MPCLGAVADDRHAARGAAAQQHPPLRVGELLRLVDDHVRERAGERIGVRVRQLRLVHEGAAQVVAAQHRHHEHLGVVGGDHVVDDVVHVRPLRRLLRLAPATQGGCLGVADALLRGIQEGQVRHGPGARLRSLQERDLGGVQPRRAQAQICGHGPQVGDDPPRVEHRPRAGEAPPQPLAAGDGAVQQLGRHLVAEPIGQPIERDLDEGLPDLVARVVVAEAGLGRRERLRPVLGVEHHVGPFRLDDEPALRRPLVVAHRRLDRLRPSPRCLEGRHARVRLGTRGRALEDEIAQCARLYPVLAEARQHVLDVAEVGGRGPDEQDAAAPGGQQRVGVDEIGGAMQRDDGLPGARAAVDDERSTRAGTDDGILVRLDRAEHVAHPR